MNDNPDQYMAWLMRRLEHIESMTTQIALDVAILKNDAKNDAKSAEKQAKRQASIISASISAVVAFFAAAWQTWFAR